MAMHSSILAWERIPWAEEYGGLLSMESQRVRHGLVTEHAHTLQSTLLRLLYHLIYVTTHKLYT